MFEPPNNSTKPAHDRNQENLPSDSEDAPKSKTESESEKALPGRSRERILFTCTCQLQVSVGGHIIIEGERTYGNLILNYFYFFTILTNIV
jgi:hypothetical protein